MIPLPLYLFILIELLFVAYIDISTKKISNYWSVLNIVLFILAAILFPEVYTVEFETFTVSLVFLAVGFVLFLLNIMGGGDSKFLFTFFLLIPLSLQEDTFYYLLLSTILVGGSFFVFNLTRNFTQVITLLRLRRYKDMNQYFGTKFAFAPVILIAWLCVGWKLKENLISIL